MQHFYEDDLYYAFPDKGEKPEPQPLDALTYTEYMCVIWCVERSETCIYALFLTFRFTFEFLLRFFVTVDKKDFIKKPLNAIDLATIVPFYIDLLVGAVGVSENFNKVSGMSPSNAFLSIDSQN